jgi:hypothetical protein
VYGCSKPSGRISRLGHSGRAVAGSTVVNRVALAGETVAYALRSFGVDSGSTAVAVRDLGTGRALGTFPGTEKSLGPESTNSVSSLVVKPGGAVAWIGIGQSIISPARDIEVRTGHGARRQLLDSGTQINPTSLRLHGSRLTWRNGRAQRSANLS